MPLVDGETAYEYEPFDPHDEDQEASLLGEGTFGATHKMRSKADGRLYAVKMMKVNMHACPHAHMHECMHAYVHTCIHDEGQEGWYAYIHAYMHTW